MSELVSFESTRGTAARGEIEVAEGHTKAPGVVLIQEWWGLNDHIRSMMGRLSKAGFVVVAPDLYHGRSTKNPDEAAQLMGSLDFSLALSEIGGAAAYLRGHERCTGKVGVMGFCMGGALSFAAATQVPGLSAVVPFYGIPGAEHADYSKVTAPILAHFATRDGWAKVEGAEAILEGMKARGQAMELCVYEADHAFMNDTRPDVYSAEAAGLAWERSMAFLHKHLG